MARILILFATVDGHTGRIAHHMAGALRDAGHEVRVRPARAPGAADDLAAYDGVILGAAIRYGSYARYVAPLIRERLRALGVPTAFFSVCLSAGGPGARPQTAQGYVDKLLDQTAWHPAQVQSFGGALLYRRYNPVIRLIMRLIVGIAGGQTDTSRDYDYTDWAGAGRFARDFAERLQPATTRATRLKAMV